MMQQYFRQRLADLVKQPAQSLEYAYFDSDQFRTPASEETLALGYGLKHDHPDAFVFWLNFLRMQDWSYRLQSFVPYVETALWTPLSEPAWRERIQTHTARLRPALPTWFHPDRPIVSAWQLYDEWNEQAAVAEYPDAFVAFQWETTA